MSRKRIYQAAGIVLGGLLVLLSTVGAAIVQSGMLDEYARKRITGYVNSEFAGTLAIGELSVRLPLTVVGKNVALYEGLEDEPVVAAETLEVTPSLSMLVGLGGGGIELQTLSATALQIRWDEYEDGTSSISRALLPAGAASEDGVPFQISVGELRLDDGRVAYRNAEQKELLLEHIDAQVEGISYAPLRIAANVSALSLSAPGYGVALDEARGNMLFTDSQSSLYNLHIKTPRSHADASFSISEFNIFSPERWKDFSNSPVYGDVRKLELHTDDLRLFTEEIPLPDGLYRLQAKAGGTLRDLSLEEVELATRQSRLHMRGELLNVNQPEFLAFNLEVGESLLGQELLGALVGPERVSTVSPLGTVNFFGTVQGDIREFSTDAEVSSGAGHGQLTATVSVPGGVPPAYEGELRLLEMQPHLFMQGLGANQSELTALVRFEGRGGLPGLEAFDAKADLAPSFWHNQHIERGTLSVTYRSNALAAMVDMTGEEVQLSMNGNIDWQDGFPRYAGVMVGRHIDLEALGLPVSGSSDLTFSSSVDGEHFTLDALAGKFSVTFNRSRLNDYLFKDGAKLDCSIERMGEQTVVNLESDVLDFKAEGRYRFTEFVEGLGITAGAVMHEVQEHDIWQRARAPLEQLELPHKEFDANYSITIHDLSPLGAFLPIEGYRFRGSVTGRSSFRGEELYLSSDMVVEEFEQNSIVAADGGSGRLELYYGADGVRAASLQAGADSLRIDTQQFVTPALEASWQEKELSLLLGMTEAETSETLRVGLRGVAEQDRYLLSIEEFNIMSRSGAWTVPSGTTAELHRNYLQINDLLLKNGPQSISCSGVLSSEVQGRFTMSLNTFSIEELESFYFTPGASGKLSATFIVEGAPGRKRSMFALTGRDIVLQEIGLGTVEFNATHQGETLGFAVHSSGMEGMNTIEGKGEVPLSLSYAPWELAMPEGRPVEALVTSKNLSAGILEFLLPFFDNPEGTMVSALKVSGRSPEPKIMFETSLKDTGLRVSPTETSYKLTGTIMISPEQARFEKIAITDIYGGTGTLSGVANLENLEVTTLDLQASFDNLQLFNKQDKQDETSYGTIFGSTDAIRFYGNIQEPILTGSLRITGADFTLYGAGANEGSKYVGIENLITFRPRYPEEELLPVEDDAPAPVVLDPTFYHSLIDIIRIDDLKLESRVPLKYSMVFDRLRGEKLETKLQNLSLMVNKRQQKYELFGSVNVTGGKYFFSNTSFDLDEGGRIAWNNDDIRNGVMQNLSGRKYVVATDIQSGETDNVRLLIMIEGKLSTPNVQMGYYLNDDSQPFASQGMIGSQSAKIDPNAELNTISLLLTKQWYIRPGSREAGSNIAFSRVGVSAGSGLISSQLSRLIMKASGFESFNVNVAVDEGGDLSGVEFSLALLVPNTGGKMRFIAAGTATNGASSSLESYYGNSQKLEYRITPKLFLEGYRSYGLFHNDVTTTNLLKPQETYGVSLSYRTRFYTWGEFWESVF